MSALLAPVDLDVKIASRGLQLSGHLSVPQRERGLVVLVRDVGRDAQSAGDHHVANRVREVGLGTLQLDLRSSQEESSGAPEIDPEVLAVRLLVATRWLRSDVLAAGRAIGYFGARAAAAVALLAAAEDPSIGAVVTWCPPSDLVASTLRLVRAPTLLLVGGGESATANAFRRAAAATRRSEHEVAAIREPLVDERGPELDAISRRATGWFLRHVPRDSKEAHVDEHER